MSDERKRRTLNIQLRTSWRAGAQRRIQNYAGAPPRAPGSGGATSGATTCLGGLSGSFLVGVELMPGGGLIRRPWAVISLICVAARVSYSSDAFALVSGVAR